MKAFGKQPSGKRLERIRKSPNYHADAFKNLEETPMLADGASYFTMTRKFFSKGIDRQPVTLLPSVKTDLKAFTEDEFSIVWFGHSSYLIHVNGKNILIDPVFSERPSPFQFMGMKAYSVQHTYSANDMPAIDVMILTHDHYDHLDYNSILKLKDRTKLFCTSLGVGEHLEYWGVPEKDILEFDWWESHDVMHGIKLTAAPSRHFSGRSLVRNKTLWSSFILETPDQRIFIGGDSGYDATFKNIGEKYGSFDLALLECGQYNSMWPFIHMAPEDTARAAVDLNAKILLPVHWGKFTLALHPWYDSITRVTKRAAELKIKITTPLIGEKIDIRTGQFPSSTWWAQ